MHDKNVSSSEKQANGSESQANKIIHKFPCYAFSKWFFEDIKRIGWGNFDHIIVAAALTETEADAYEALLIEKHGTMNPEKGYNLRSGGRGNFPVESVCRNISKAKLGHLVSESTRQKLREKVPARQVIQISLTDGSMVAVHPSLTSAAQAVGAFKSNIWAVCMGQKSTCKGYRWEYADVLAEVA